MNSFMLIVIAVMAVLTVVTCVLLVAMELHQAASTRKTVERRLLQTKLELRRLRKEMAKEGLVGDGTLQRARSDSPPQQPDTQTSTACLHHA